MQYDELHCSQQFLEKVFTLTVMQIEKHSNKEIISEQSKGEKSLGFKVETTYNRDFTVGRATL